jgi:hypothetical protein
VEGYVMADIVEHFKKGTFEDQYWLPAHNKRRESSLKQILMAAERVRRIDEELASLAANNYEPYRT